MFSLDYSWNVFQWQYNYVQSWKVKVFLRQLSLMFPIVKSTPDSPSNPSVYTFLTRTVGRQYPSVNQRQTSAEIAAHFPNDSPVRQGWLAATVGRNTEMGNRAESAHGMCYILIRDLPTYWPWMNLHAHCGILPRQSEIWSILSVREKTTQLHYYVLFLHRAIPWQNV